MTCSDIKHETYELELLDDKITVFAYTVDFRPNDMFVFESILSLC
jgi:hypothetical protein